MYLESGTYLGRAARHRVCSHGVLPPLLSDSALPVDMVIKGDDEFQLSSKPLLSVFWQGKLLSLQPCRVHKAFEINFDESEPHTINCQNNFFLEKKYFRSTERIISTGICISMRYYTHSECSCKLTLWSLSLT